MSTVETPPPPSPPQPAQRRCPRCGSALTGEQEWCLECGASVGATIAPPPSWRGPVALVAVLLTVAVLALVLALVELAGDAEQVAPGPAAQTPAPTATPPGGVATTPTPDSFTIPPATGDETTGTTPEIADWPAGKDAWTIVLEAAATREAADARATELAGQGVPVGILDSDDYGSLEPGKFVVFSGQYDSQRAATQGLEDLAGQVEGAYVRHVAPEASAGGAATATPGATATATPPPTP